MIAVGGPVGEIRPGLHRIPAPLEERFVALYLLEGPAGALLFDTGLDETVAGTLLPYLDEIGMPLDRLRWAITSHCDYDHTGGTAALLEAAPHVELLAGAADVPMTEDLELLIRGRYGEFRDADGFDDPPELTAWIREVARLAPVTRALHGGEEIDLGDRRIRVVHVPGHSPGHLAVWDERSRAVVIGDATLGATVPFADGRAAFPPTYRDTDPYLASIETFRALEPELLLTAHYPVFEGDAVSAFLDESADYTEVLDRALLGAIDDTPRTTLDLIRAIAPQVGPWGPGALEYLIFPVTGNLERLADRGAITLDDDPVATGGHRVWSRA